MHANVNVSITGLLILLISDVKFFISKNRITTMFLRPYLALLQLYVYHCCVSAVLNLNVHEIWEGLREALREGKREKYGEGNRVTERE
jgi:hypothetical protein